jgi:hypothetical protein
MRWTVVVLSILGMSVLVCRATAAENDRTANWTSTGLTCFHCHADFNEKKTPDGQVRLGHSLFNAGFRTLLHRWDR